MESFKNIVRKRAGATRIQPCLDLAFYWGGSPFPRSDAITEFYEESLKLVGDDIKYYRTETMTTAKPLKKDSLELIPFWFQKTKSKREVYMLFLESGTSANEPSDRAFALDANPTAGYVRLILPTSFIAESPKAFVELAQSAADMSSFDLGHAGFGVNWDWLDEDSDVLKAMSSLGKRYPGLDISEPQSTAYIASEGIKCANWLTFLNADLAARIGGLNSLREQFGKDIVVKNAKGGGVMIQAGPSPEIGDVNQNKDVPLYREVGQVLAPIRAHEHPAIFGPDGFADEDATDDWLSRFD